MTAGQRIAPSAVLLVAAIGISGIAAAVRVSPALWLGTPLMAWIILRAAARDAAVVNTADLEIRELPFALRERVRSSFAQLPEGDARRLLLTVVNQARLLFARGESAFDASEENQLRDHVAGLVDACCTTAADLARVDQFTRDSAVVGADLVTRVTKARTLFRDRLTSASAALAELYTANLERGTPSTDRVADLTAEISADAAARSAAVGEVKDLLGE